MKLGYIKVLISAGEYYEKRTPTVRVDPPATPPLQYSRDQLLYVPPSGLDATALSNIRQLGIGYRLPKTRTHRAGRRKQNAIRTIVNSRSDTLFTPSPTTLPNCTATTGRSDNTRHINLISVSLQPDVQPTNTTGFRIALFNAQSVGSSEKCAEISTFVTDTRIDLFFITETWLNHRDDEAKIAELAPSGYSARSFPRRSRGGGLAVVFRDTLSTNLTFKTKFDFDHSSFELIQVSVTLQTSDLHFMCMYRPPPSRKNKLTDSLFSEQFPDLIDTCNSLRGQICILGDMNIHYDCPDHPLTSKTLDLLYMYNFKQVVSQSTHRRGHILDCIIIRPSDQIHLSSEVTDSLESDHLCVMSCFDVSVARSCPVYRYVRNIRAIDRSAFVADLGTELVGIGHSLSADQYNVTLRSVLDKHAPAAKTRVTERMSSPWFGLVREDLLEAKRSRRQAERKWRNTNLTVFKYLYKKAKHHVTNVVLKAKKLYYNSKISSANCSKELYKITNNILARTKQVHLPTTYPLYSLPELFSNYFSDKIMKIRN